MPNHETNHVVILGTEEQVKRVLEEVIKTIPESDRRYDDDPHHDFDFEAIVPSPPNKETGGCSGQHEPGVVCWYSWNVDNWGTKWDAYSFDDEAMTMRPYSEGYQLYVIFQTAWSAPTPVFEALETKFEVQVHAWTEDEGGFDPAEYGEPDRFLDIQLLVWNYDEDRPAKEGDSADSVGQRWQVALRGVEQKASV